MKILNLTIIAILLSLSVQAQWDSYYDNQQVAYLDGYQGEQFVIPDNEGGTYVVWEDEREGLNDWRVYAQHFDSLGHPSWAINGIQVCQHTFDQKRVQAVSDNSGGLIIAWDDYRDTSQMGTGVNIYAQRLDKSGSLMWGSTGTPVVNAEGEQSNSLMVAESGGGAFIAWRDAGDVLTSRRKGYYMQKIENSGNKSWLADGELVHPVSQGSVFNSAVDLSLCSDGTGGAVLVYNEASTDQLFFNNIYGHRINSAGGREWPAEIDSFLTFGFERGFPIAKSQALQTQPKIDLSPEGDIYVCWRDERNGATQFGNLYAQRMDVNGNFHWQANGIQISNGEMGGGNQPDLEPDGMGGIFFHYPLSPAGNSSMVHFDSAGSASWTNPIDLGSNIITPTDIRVNAMGEAWLAWTESGVNPGSEDGIVVQGLDQSGNLLRMNGEVISTYPEDKGEAELGVNANGHLFVAWQDYRRTNGQAGQNADADLFVQKFNKDATVGFEHVEASPDLLRIEVSGSTLKINLKSGLIPNQAWLFSLDGSELIHTEHASNMDIGSLPNGVYILAAESEGQLLTSKVFAGF